MAQTSYLIKATRTHQGSIDYIRTIGSSQYKNSLKGYHIFRSLKFCDAIAISYTDWSSASKISMLTLASSKPSISVRRVVRSLSSTETLLLEFLPLPFKNAKAQTAYINILLHITYIEIPEQRMNFSVPPQCFSIDNKL